MFAALIFDGVMMDLVLRRQIAENIKKLEKFEASVSAALGWVGPVVARVSTLITQLSSRKILRPLSALPWGGCTVAPRCVSHWLGSWARRKGGSMSARGGVFASVAWARVLARCLWPGHDEAGAG